MEGFAVTNIRTALCNATLNEHSVEDLDLRFQVSQTTQTRLRIPFGKASTIRPVFLSAIPFSTLSVALDDVNDIPAKYWGNLEVLPKQLGSAYMCRPTFVIGINLGVACVPEVSKNLTFSRDKTLFSPASIVVPMVRHHHRIELEPLGENHSMYARHQVVRSPRPFLANLSGDRKTFETGTL